MMSLEKLVKVIANTLPQVLEWTVPFTGPSFQGSIVVLDDGATIAPDLTQGEGFYFDATDNSVRQFVAPTGLADGGFFDLTLSNTSGGALTNTTFSSAYKGVPTLPADTKQRDYRFRWDGTHAFLAQQTAADVPN